VTDRTDSPTARPRWDLVALTVAYRRQQLGLSMAEVAARVGVTTEAWSQLESGSRPSGFHRAEAHRASAALGWTPESLDRIVRGQRPLDAPAAPATLARAAAPRARPSEPAGRGAPWILAPLCTRGPDRIRHVDPARVAVLGGLVILVAVVLLFFR
jgi:transcriptional regulator with XRE-family HTH domain